MISQRIGLSVKRPRRIVSAAALFLILALIACNVPSCGQQPAPTPRHVDIPPTVNLADLPPTNPQIVAQRPYPGEEIPLNGSIDLYFDQPMNQESVEGLIAIEPSLDTEIVWVDDSTLRLTPEPGSLERATVYTVRVGEGAESSRGLKMETPYEAEIQTVGFLAVGEVVPNPDAPAVEPDSVITVFFNRPVVPLIVAEDMPGLPQPLTFSPDVPGTGEWLNTSIYQWHPDLPLAGGQTYTVTVDGTLTDQTGGVMTGPYTWSFTTLPPNITEVSPADTSLNIGLDQPVVVTFNQPMDHPTTEAAFTLTEENSGQGVAGSFEWSEDSRLMTFTPSGGLALDGRYRAGVTQSAQGVTGGVTLAVPMEWTFSAVHTPAVIRTQPADGAQNAPVYEGLHFYFSAPMDMETLTEDLIVAEPALPDDTTFYYSDYDQTWNVNMQLDPSTSYTVTLLPGAADPYGNAIGDTTTISFTTAPLDPLVQLNVQSAFGIYDANRATELFVLYRNVSQVSFQLARLSLEEFGSLSGPEGYNLLSSYTPSSNALVRDWIVPAADAVLNEANYVRVPLIQEDGSSLPPGIYLLIADAPETGEGDIRHFVIVTDTNLTFKNSFDESLVWLTDFQTGQPVAGVPVTLYDKDFRQLAQGTTNSDGILEVATPHQIYLWETFYAVAQNADRFAVAMTGWSDGINAWEFGLPLNYEFQDFSLYLYTDRPLYRPGQDVFFKGVWRTKNDVTYALPDDATINIQVYNDQGDVITEQDVPVNEVGTFNGTFHLDEEASLGYYTLQATIDDRFIGLGIQVAEYRKPEFIVTVTPESEQVVAGDTINVTADAEYFFGGPVSGAEVTWTALSDIYFFQYEGPGQYSFSDYDYDVEPSPDFVPGFGQVIADGTGTTNADGEFVISLPASLEQENQSQRLTVEATVTEVNAQSVSGRAEIIIHKGLYYAGVRPDEYVSIAGEETSASLIVVDWNSQPVPNTEVTVQIAERRWSSVQEEDEFGRTQWTWSVEDIPVGDPITVETDRDGLATVEFTPPSGGTYKILATVADPQGREQRSSAFVWVSSSEFVSWRQENNDRITVVADKDTYQPGDTAEILIASPFQGEVQALITLERGSILTHEVITLPNNSYVYRLPITGDLAPNLYFSVILIKGVDETNPLPAFKLGMVAIEIEPSEQTLNIEVTPDRVEVGPREEITYTVRTTNSAGDAVDAEVSLALVDLAALSLALPNTGPILDHFYGVQPLGVQTSVPLVFLVNRRNQELFDKGKGGGGGGAEGFFDIRGEFKDTAYWEAQVRTGDDGEAEVSITLPDNLTTWRMDARGVTADSLVGSTTTDIISTKPLLIRPVTPRFFVVNDEVTLSAVVNNNTDRDINAEVVLAAQGVSIVGDAGQVVSIPARGRVEVSWAVIANADAEWADLVFSVEGGRLSDASKPTLGDPEHDQQLPIYRYEVPETVGTAGQLEGAQSRTEGVVLPPTYEVTQGYVRVQIDPSLAASTVDGLQYLEEFPYECTEQTVSRFLPNALTINAFRKFNLQDAELEANLELNVQTGLQRLYSQQHVDGGWGWFINGPSNSVVTGYAIQGLLAAREAGFTVEQRVIDDAVGYVQGQLRPLDELDAHWRLDRQAYLLYVLALAGQPDVSRTVQMYENREGLQHWGRALLAQAMWMIDPNDSRLGDIESDLVNSAILSATGAHWEEDLDDEWNWNTDTRSTAMILDTFAKVWPDNELGPNVVRWLMIARQGSHWETTQETAWALIGLTNWMVVTGELQPDYTWNFRFNGAQVSEGEATVATVRDSTVLTIDVADLVKGEVNRLLFERTDGAGRMYYTAHLTAYLPVEQIEPLSRGVVVSRRYLDADGNPVTEGRIGDVVTVEVTIVAPNDLYYVVVEDPYPAGAEPVDTDLLTESVLGERPELAPDDPLTQGWGWWWFSDTDFRDEKAVMFAETLPAGTYQYTYQLRLGMPGAFRVIPTTASEFYFPEVYGRGDGMLFTILPEQ